MMDLIISLVDPAVAIFLLIGLLRLVYLIGVIDLSKEAIVNPTALERAMRALAFIGAHTDMDATPRLTLLDVHELAVEALADVARLEIPRERAGEVVKASNIKPGDNISFSATTPPRPVLRVDTTSDRQGTITVFLYVKSDTAADDVYLLSPNVPVCRWY